MNKKKTTNEELGVFALTADILQLVGSNPVLRLKGCGARPESEYRGDEYDENDGNDTIF